MRSVALLLVSSIAATSLSAQITITEQDMRDAYKVGRETTSRIDLEAESIDIGQRGGGNTWDYSELEFAITVPWAAIDPDDGRDNESFPDASACVATSYTDEGLTYSVWSYMLIDGGVYELGTTATDPSESLSLLTTITPRNQLMPLPATFEDTWSSEYTSVTKINGMTFNTRTVSQTAVADAYGTLLLPDGSTQDVLRIKVVETDNDGSRTSFLFIAKNGAFFAVEAAPGTSSDEGVITVTGANYHSGSTQTSVAEDGGGTSAKHVKAFPNPASSRTTLAYSLDQAGRVQVSVFTRAGEQVLRSGSVFMPAGDHQMMIPCDRLASGQYVVRISRNGHAVDLMIVVQR